MKVYNIYTLNRNDELEQYFSSDQDKVKALEKALKMFKKNITKDGFIKAEIAVVESDTEIRKRIDDCERVATFKRS